MKQSNELERSALRACAEFMAAAARTAPKTRGIDNIVVCVINREAEVRTLAQAMRALFRKTGRPSLQRDAATIEDLRHIVLLGVRRNPAGLNCGFCGYKDCAALAATRGICAFNAIDLGIATGSAVSVAARCRIDNRIMYSIGRAAIASGVLGKGVAQALGIPLSVSGKSPFFDRK